MVAVVLSVALAAKVAQVFVTDDHSVANVLAEVGAVLVLIGWWRFVMQPPEERRDGKLLWAWARFGVVLLSAAVMVGTIDAISR